MAYTAKTGNPFLKTMVKGQLGPESCLLASTQVLWRMYPPLYHNQEGRRRLEREERHRHTLAVGQLCFPPTVCLQASSETLRQEKA